MRMLEESCWNKRNLYYEEGCFGRKHTATPSPTYVKHGFQMLHPKVNKIPHGQQAKNPSVQHMIILSLHPHPNLTVKGLKKEKKNQIPESMEHDFRVNHGI